MMARKNSQKRHWEYMGLLVQDSLEQRARHTERPGEQSTGAHRARACTHTRQQSRQEATPHAASRERTAAGRRGSQATRQQGSRAAEEPEGPHNRT